MTDNEIIMGLTQCIGVDGSCRVCPYWGKCEYENNDVMLKDVCDLINRQKAEIERLQEEVRIANIAGVAAEQQALKECREKHKIAQGIETARSEAVNEFVEKLKAKALVVHKNRRGKLTYEIDDDEIDSLVKEG